MPEELKKWISETPLSDEIKKKAIDLINQRDTYGFNKYGQHLMTQDGRNTKEDAKQELGDLFQYICKMIMNGEDTTSIEELLPFLDLILKHKDHSRLITTLPTASQMIAFGKKK